MNQDEIKSIAIKIGLTIFLPLATKYHMDGNTATALVTDVVNVALLAYGIYEHRGMKKVPQDALVITPGDRPPLAQQAGGR